MKKVLIPALIVMALSTPAMAGELACSIRPTTGTADSDLPGLTKISQADAQKIALSNVKAKGKKTLDGELEVEDGCLLYSFDIRVSGKSGLEEVMVDAGTGKILSHTHESKKQEVSEQIQDAKDMKEQKK